MASSSSRTTFGVPNPYTVYVFRCFAATAFVFDSSVCPSADTAPYPHTVDDSSSVLTCPLFQKFVNCREPRHSEFVCRMFAATSVGFPEASTVTFVTHPAFVVCPYTPDSYASITCALCPWPAGASHVSSARMSPT